MKSWKTTILGIVTGIGMLATQIQAVLDNDPATALDYKAVLAALGLMGIGWFCRDNDKSSEDVKAK